MNKKILIFGGTGAIGFSIAKKMNEEGYSPVIISRNKEDLASKAENIGCEYETCDILDSDQIENVSKKYNDEVVGLAYCVGSINLKPLRMSKNDDFIDSFKINTLGAINVIKSNLPSLTKNTGSILLFSTIWVIIVSKLVPKIY